MTIRSILLTLISELLEKGRLLLIGFWLSVTTFPNIPNSFCRQLDSCRQKLFTLLKNVISFIQQLITNSNGPITILRKVDTF